MENATDTVSNVWKPRSRARPTVFLFDDDMTAIAPVSNNIHSIRHAQLHNSITLQKG